MTAMSALYAGTVMHQRLRPLRHRLRYRVFSLLIDLDELPALHQRLRWFSVNRFNLFSLHERDYGAGAAVRLRDHVDRQLHHAGLASGGPVRLLTMPRILGYAFNPLSVYFCHRPDGALQALLYEVNNTFGERHSYLIPVNAHDATAAHIHQRCAKQFHVSPFLGLAMDYAFDVTAPAPERPGLTVSVTAHDAEGPVLLAQMHTQRRPLTDAALLWAFVAHPLLTLKVVGAIHWEALRLWIKGADVRSKPPPPAHPVSIVPHQDP